MITSFGNSNVYQGEGDMLIMPRENIPKKVGTIYVHGAESPGAANWMETKSRWPAIKAIGEHGVMVSSDLGGGDTWGNNTVISRISLANDFLKKQFSVSNGKINVLAQSMGGVSSISWIARNLTIVNKVVLIIPVINLQDVYANSGYKSAIDNAYGGSYNDAIDGPNHNPIVMARAGKFKNVKFQIWYGINDNLCKAEYTEEFATYCDSCDMRPLNGGHTEEIQNLIDPSLITSFMFE